MAVDVVAVCDRSGELASVQLLAILLTALFAAYVLIDSLLVGVVIFRKVYSAERAQKLTEV